MAFIKEKFVAVVLTVLSAATLLLGIHFRIYDSFSVLKYLGEAFQLSFWMGLYYLLMIALLVAAAAGVICGILAMCNVLKVEKLNAILTYVVAGLIVAAVVDYLIMGGGIVWSTLINAILGVAAIVVVALRKRLVK